MIVLAGGPSAKAFLALGDAIPLEHVIAVNAALDAMRGSPGHFFTMDPASRVRRLIEKHRKQTSIWVSTRRKTVANCNHLEKVLGGRLVGEKEPEPQNTIPWWLWRYSCKLGLPKPWEIHAGNSAYGALQLATHMGAKRVVLAGVDGTTDKGLGGYHSGPLVHLPALFQSLVPGLEELGVEVVNASSVSAVDCFPRMTPKEALEWWRQGNG